MLIAKGMLVCVCVGGGGGRLGVAGWGVAI